MNIIRFQYLLKIVLNPVADTHPQTHAHVLADHLVEFLPMETLRAAPDRACMVKPRTLATIAVVITLHGAVCDY